MSGAAGGGRRDGYRVAVVGATGAVGTVMRETLRAHGFPAREVVPFASERSAGKELDGAVIQPLREDTIQGFDLALFSAGGATSLEWGPKFVAAGCVVVDNSSAYRMHDDVPLVVSEVNPHALERHRGLIANPNCSTMQMVVALKPLHDAATIERLVVSTFQAVSGTGVAAVEVLKEQARRVLAGDEAGDSGPYAHQIAFNVLPHAGKFVDDLTDEEHKLINETRKILEAPEIRVSATCTRVPVVNGHSEAVNVELRSSLSADEARALLEAAPGLTVVDDPAAGQYPMAVDADGREDVLVGRIRQDRGHERALDLFVVGDNLRKGAATNAVQVAEALHERDLVRVPEPAFA